MQPGSSLSEPRASTSIAFRKRSRASDFTRTFTHIASMPPPFCQQIEPRSPRAPARTLPGRRSYANVKAGQQPPLPLQGATASCKRRGGSKRLAAETARRRRSVELDRSAKFGLADRGEPISRIDRASDPQEELREGLGRLDAQWLGRRDHRDLRSELIRSRHGNHRAQLRVCCRKITREMVKDDAGVGGTARYRLQHIAVLDTQPARKGDNFAGEN